MVKCEEYSQVCVIEVQGDLLAETAAAAKKALEDHVEQRKIVDFVVDFQKCPFIDSDGLESLLWMKRRCDEPLRPNQARQPRRELPQNPGDHPPGASL